MKEKTTSGGSGLQEGLNEGNPNTERTPSGPHPVQTGADIDLTGGTTQQRGGEMQGDELPGNSGNTDAAAGSRQ
ncbi:MAG TPA: hypothetical protein VHK69_09265 [Chitinophagaceae bacterium]|nr:hypothetical protein [Chitinophagaceae bacterium]